MAPRLTAIHVRRAHPGDAEAIMAAFSTPRAMAGTLQLPYPSAELWSEAAELGFFPALALSPTKTKSSLTLARMAEACFSPFRRATDWRRSWQ